MYLFIAREEKERRLVAVRCPCCGGRVLDATYGTKVMVSGAESSEPPDYIIKCWRCKRLLGVRETREEECSTQKVE